MRLTRQKPTSRTSVLVSSFSTRKPVNILTAKGQKDKEEDTEVQDDRVVRR